MNTVYVYGDSFAAASTPIQNLDWPSRFAIKLGCKIKHRAMTGGSTEHALKCLLEDYERFVEGDVVVFCRSTPGRLKLEFQKERPETAAVYLHPVKDYKLPKHEWYRENKKYLEWLVANQDGYIETVIHEALTHLVRNIAEKLPKVTFIFLINSNITVNVSFAKDLDNFLRPNIELLTICNEELISDEPETAYYNWIKKTQIDLRDNHMSIPNLEILSDLLVEAVKTKKVDHISMDKFKKNLLKPVNNIQQYMDYVNAGLLPYQDWKVEHLR